MPTRSPIIVLDGMRRMYEEGEAAIYYITLDNENYRHPPMPAGVEEGILARHLQGRLEGSRRGRPRVQLFGSGAILARSAAGAGILAEKYGVSSDVWSVTSYTELARDAESTRALEHAAPDREAAGSRSSNSSWRATRGRSSPASDYVRALAEQISPWVPGGLFALGTDGFGRSEARKELRRHFEVDAECITLATLYQLAQAGQVRSPARWPRRSASWASIRRKPIRWSPERRPKTDRPPAIARPRRCKSSTDQG